MLLSTSTRLHSSHESGGRSLRTALYAVAVAIVMAGASIPRVSAETVTLATDPWPPYVTGDLDRGVNGGIIFELVTEIFARIDGVEVEFAMLPWKRALAEVRNGALDGIPMLLKTPERETYMAYTDPLATSRSLIWYSKERFPNGFGWEQVDDLISYRIGVARGYSYGVMDAPLKSGRFDVTAVNDTSQLFRMLKLQRLDLVLANDAVGYTQIERHADAGSIVPADKETEVETHYMSFSKKSPAVHLIPQINRIMAEMRKEGVTARILRRPTT